MQIYILNSQFKERASRSVYVLLSKTQSFIFFLLRGIEIFHDYDDVKTFSNFLKKV